MKKQAGIHRELLEQVCGGFDEHNNYNRKWHQDNPPSISYTRDGKSGEVYNPNIIIK